MKHSQISTWSVVPLNKQMLQNKLIGISIGVGLRSELNDKYKGTVNHWLMTLTKQLSRYELIGKKTFYMILDENKCTKFWMECLLIQEIFCFGYDYIFTVCKRRGVRHII